jgi:hypothetical protein
VEHPHDEAALEHDALGEHAHGEAPPGLGPEVFRERLEQASRDAVEFGGQIVVEDEDVYLEDIEAVDEEATSGHSRIRLRNGVIIGGLTGAAIVAALATVRFRHRHR